MPTILWPLPPAPWPRFVRLSGNSSEDDVALTVAALARYGHDRGGPNRIEALVEEFPHVAPGGLAAVDGETSVHPSCCCGLESWREWYQLLEDGTSPWLGHDPWPWVERRGDELLVWPDGGLVGATNETNEPIRFSSFELDASLAAVEHDLQRFITRLRDWCSIVAPDSSEALAERFRELVRLP